MPQDWGTRIAAWTDYPDHCLEPGAYLLLFNADKMPVRRVEFQEDVLRVNREYVERWKEQTGYPLNCMWGTTPYLMWVAGGSEHTRVCEAHAREGGWIW